jgi:sugar phosphate isomerase/epimerase
MVHGVTRRAFLGSSGAALAAAGLMTSSSQAGDKMPKPRFGLGVTSFAVPGFGQWDLYLDNLDSVRIPPTNGRVVEIFVAHNPDGGVDLDDPGTDFLKGARDLGQRLGDRNYGRIVLAFHPPGSPDLLSADPAEVDKAVNRTCHIIDYAKALGAKLIAGPFHREHMQHYNKEGEEKRDSGFLVKPLTRIVEYATDKDIEMALEMINIWETYSCTNIESAMKVVGQVPGLGLHYDTAHASREELDSADLSRSIRRAHGKGILKHVHISPNGRGSLVEGDFVTEQLPGIFQTLTELGYEGKVDFEGFPLGLWGAVARGDYIEAAGKSPAELDKLCLDETRQSMAIMCKAYAQCS